RGGSGASWGRGVGTVTFAMRAASFARACWGRRTVPHSMADDKRIARNLSHLMEPRRYLIRTFGCQMNEHDSERIAGLFEADGLAPTEEASRAQVIVLNTCAIRENADNRLYGNLGHLKPIKDRNPGLRIVVAGCPAQKDRW